MSIQQTQIYNLPLQPTPFIGRKKEVAELSAITMKPNIRLVTILGSGGMGKTRLALQVATERVSDFADGVYFIPLAPLRSADNIASTIADIMGFEFFGSSNPEHQLFEYLQTKSILLILDNFEHLLDGALFASNLVAYASNVKVLVTSRATLNLRGETVYSLSGLDSPDQQSSQNLIEYDAVRLFVESAQRVDSGYELEEADTELMSQICQLVEGMPLGLELAAAWVRILSLQDIVTEIQNSLDFLATNAQDMPDRLRSIRAVFERSWDLLTDDEREVFRKLSVFRGGFTRESANVVTGATLLNLTALMDKSLLQWSNDTKRYEIHELLRQYTTEKLDAIPQEQILIHDRHATYFADFIQQREEGLIRGDEQEREVIQELDNIRVAWHWAITQERFAEAYKFIFGFQLLHEYQGTRFEGATTFEWAADQLREAVPTGQKGIMFGLILCLQSFFFRRTDRSKQANQLVWEGVSILRQLDTGEALAQGYIQMSRQGMGEPIDNWNYEEKLRLLHEGLVIFENAGNQHYVIHTLLTLGNVARDNADLKRAIDYYEQGLQLSRSQDLYRDTNWALWGLSNCHAELGSYELARTYIVEVLNSGKETDRRGSTNFRILAQVDYDMGDYSQAWKGFCRCLQLEMLHPYLAAEKLQTLWSMSRILMQKSELISATEILTLVQAHPASVKSTKQSADELLSQLKTTLTDEEFDTAQQRGKNLQLDDLIAQILQEYEATQAKTKPQDVAPTLDDLTARELEILRLVAQGKSNREVADDLIIATGTVKWYVSQIYSKLHVRNRAEAIHRVRELGLLS